MAGLAEKYPDLQDAYNAKIEFATNFSQNFQNRELVVKVLNDLEKILDEVEKVLKKVKEGKIRHAHYVCWQRGVTTCTKHRELYCLGLNLQVLLAKVTKERKIKTKMKNCISYLTYAEFKYLYIGVSI